MMPTKKIGHFKKNVISWVLLSDCFVVKYIALKLFSIKHFHFIVVGCLNENAKKIICKSLFRSKNILLSLSLLDQCTSNQIRVKYGLFGALEASNPSRLSSHHQLTITNKRNPYPKSIKQPVHVVGQATITPPPWTNPNHTQNTSTQEPSNY